MSQIFQKIFDSDYASAFGLYGDQLGNRPMPRQHFEPQNPKGFFEYSYKSGNVLHFCGYCPLLSAITGLIRVILAGIQLHNQHDFDQSPLNEKGKANLWSEVGRGILEVLQFTLILAAIDAIFTLGRLWCCPVNNGYYRP